MIETKKNKKAADENMDWAVIRFDAAADDARWLKLVEDTDLLLAETEEIKTAGGELIVKNKLSCLAGYEQEAEDMNF